MAMVARMMPMKLTIFLLYTVLLLCPEDVVLVEHSNNVCFKYGNNAVSLVVGLEARTPTDTYIHPVREVS